MAQATLEPSKPSNESPKTLELKASPLEELASGLSFQWIFDHRAVAFYAQNTKRELVDAWFYKVIDIAKSLPENRVLFVLNDFSGKDCATTPYNRQKNRELLEMFPNRRTTTAVVVKENLTMQLSRLFVRVLPRRKVNVYLSFKREEAIDWLKQQLENYENNNSNKA
jgi:hypothetical protein